MRVPALILSHVLGQPGGVVMSVEELVDQTRQIVAQVGWGVCVGHVRVRAGCERPP
jgi:hypothetical protein